MDQNKNDPGPPVAHLRESPSQTSGQARDFKNSTQPQNDFLIQAPAVQLPKGGGAIRAIDEKFSINPATGAASLTIPIATSSRIKNDKAVCQYTHTATQTGPGNFPPTGKVIKIHGVLIIKVVDSKITESWVYWNNEDWNKQLGYTITPPATTSEN